MNTFFPLLFNSMKGLNPSLKSNSFCSLSSLTLFLLLSLFPLCITLFAFFLRLGGGPTNDPVTRWPVDHSKFPGMLDFADPTRVKSSSSKGCATNVLGQSSSPVFPYFRGWKYNYNESDIRPKICITTSTSAGLEQVLPWIFYHKVIGISNFFLFAEGKASTPSVSKVLESIPGVKVISRTRELEEQQANSRVWNETWLSNFFYKPCNNELFVKQTLNMEMAIALARDAGMEWIFHLDTDELLHPAGTREYSIRELLSEVPQDVDMVVFSNYESVVERDDIKQPFTEVSMFKKNYDHLPQETYFGNYEEAARGNPNYFLTYANGKAAARIQDHLRPNGAHRWHNYMNDINEIKVDEAAVLHYTYSRFSDLTSRRKRCACKPTKDDLQRCFMLQFDRDAFIIASVGSQEEMLQWYREHIVWTDETLRLKLLKSGVLTRIYEPMVIIQGLRESGVFASVIASAQTTPSGSVELSSNGQSNSSAKMDSIKIGRGFEPTTRKMLDIGEETDDFQAIPPLSPPSKDDYITL